MKNLILLFLGLLLAIIGQAQIATKTVNLTTVGTLSTVLTANELSSTVGLTLTGTIDARDFKTMRDLMPLLSFVDLGCVTIVAYTGTEGTYSTSSTVYPANTIPKFAFRNPSTGIGKTSLTSFLFPLSVTSIGQSAFENCSGLSGMLTIPSLVTTIGNYCFNGCIGFTSVNIPSLVANIGSYAFRNNSGLINVDIENPYYYSHEGVLFNAD